MGALTCIRNSVGHYSYNDASEKTNEEGSGKTCSTHKQALPDLKRGIPLQRRKGLTVRVCCTTAICSMSWIKNLDCTNVNWLHIRATHGQEAVTSILV